ncbi:MAG TPA: tetratricopeptide repeat protein [Syntrophorhabdales bacterium]|nr:tetratricopeptide repeat protein [Syntrophorhabdales bacterium]
MALFNVKDSFIIINTGTFFRRVIFTVIMLIGVSPAIYRSYRIFRADRIARAEQTYANYSSALQYDPADATLWWYRGRLRHYSVEAVDISKAISDYQMALSLNPRLSQAWVDLADCYERTGRYTDAETSLDHALSTHTYSPLTRWQVGNYFLRRGNLPRMYECFKIACDYDPEKLGIAFDIAWKVDTDHPGIMQKLVPDKLSANLRYFDFLVSHDELDLARAAWGRVLKSAILPESEFNVSSSFGYIDRLLSVRRVEEAERVWDEVLQMAGSGLRDTRIVKQESGVDASGHANLVWNGSFENEILQGGFDWRFPGMQDAKFEVALDNCMEGLKCLKVTFEGTNISFSHLSQIVPIPSPGNYVLEFYFRTEGLTTDQTPYLAIQGYPEASGASLSTDHFPESTRWEKRSCSFVVKENCKAIQLTLRRDHSSKFNNQIKGSLWLDGVSIYAEPVSTGAATGRGAVAGY